MDATAFWGGGLVSFYYSFNYFLNTKIRKLETQKLKYIYVNNTCQPEPRTLHKCILMWLMSLLRSAMTTSSEASDSTYWEILQKGNINERRH